MLLFQRFLTNWTVFLPHVHTWLFSLKWDLKQSEAIKPRVICLSPFAHIPSISISKRLIAQVVPLPAGVSTTPVPRPGRCGFPVSSSGTTRSLFCHQVTRSGETPERAHTIQPLALDRRPKPLHDLSKDGAGSLLFELSRRLFHARKATNSNANSPTILYLLRIIKPS